jgi:hypothetical protein
MSDLSRYTLAVRYRDEKAFTEHDLGTDESAAILAAYKFDYESRPFADLLYHQFFLLRGDSIVYGVNADYNVSVVFA